MRLYAPAKPSSSTGEEDGRRQQQDETIPREDNNNNNNNNNNKNYHYDPRPAELTRRSIENDPRFDDKLQLNVPRHDDKAPSIHTRFDDKLLLNGPLRDEQRSTPTSVVESVKKSPPTTTSSPQRNSSSSYSSVDMNGVPTSTSTSSTPPSASVTSPTTTQNGPSSSIDHSPPLLENGTDSLRSLDSIPWNLDGTETIIKNGSRPTIKNGSVQNEEEDELKRLKEENKKFKAALEEAAEVNGQWRQYHDERQGYVQRLLTTIHELQHAHSSSAPSPRQLDGEGGSGGQEGEVRRLREALTRLQADHHEHVQLLEMQVRAHRDDWEAERSEKRSAEATLTETEARAALLLQELQLLQAKLADSESKRSLCWRCLCPRTDYNNHRSGSTSAPRTPQASPIPAPGGGASPAPVIPSAPPPDNPPVPLKGWIPVSMLHQIAFSGATPEHQTPVVQSQPHPQQANRTHAPGQSQNIPNLQQTPHQQQPLQQQKTYQQSHQPNQAKQQQMQQIQMKQQHLQVQQQPRQQHQTKQQQQSSINCMPKPASSSSSSNMRGIEFIQNSNAHEKAGNMIGGVVDDKKRYEAMGARPKMLGDLHSVTGKGVGVTEDEKSAKHRARSILASAIPVSPVSGGPSTPCGVNVTRSSSNMLKGYVPITSTVLTPINFRPPFVAHKRPSAVKHTAQGPKVSSQASSSIGPVTPPTHVRSDASPASLCVSSSNNKNVPKVMTSPITKKLGDSCKNSESTAKKDPRSNDQSIAQSSECKHSPSSSTKKLSSSSVSEDASSCKDPKKSPLGVNKCLSSEYSEGMSIVTTTISCSSPCTATTSTSSLSNKANGAKQTSKSSELSSSQGSTNSTSSVTAFASITVATTAASLANCTTTTSSYSSTTSSRSSSPGMSLTTFGLNSEGRGIPGAICFALGSEQKGTRNPQQCVSPHRVCNSSVMSPTPDMSTAGQSQKDVMPPTGVMSPTILINNAPPPTTVKEEHWWSVESPGRSKQQNSGKLVNSTWVRLMGGQTNNRQGSGLPWRTARAVSGQQIARKLSNEEISTGTTSPNSVSSSTATFNYTPAVNSPPSSNLPSATNSAPSSPPPNPNQPHGDDLKSMASKNISSAILSYELSAKCDVATAPSEVSPAQSWSKREADNTVNDGVATMTRRDLVCPSCQMLFLPEKHLEFLDHFEVCRGPEYADL